MADEPDPRKQRSWLEASQPGEAEKESVPPEFSVVSGPDWQDGSSTTFPEEFGPYHIIKKLGQGSTGTVYLAHDTKHDRDLALKVPVFESEERGVASFRRDAAALKHPNICNVHEMGEIDGIPYLAMEFMEGESLAESVEPGKPADARQAAVLVRKLALALHAAHERGINHLALKLSNIMVRKGEPVIMDFAQPHFLNAENSPLTCTGAALDNLAYWPPEQALAKLEAIGPRSDIYSLGVVLFEMLTGRLPFEAPDGKALVAKMVTQPPPPPSQFCSNLDPQLDTICLKAMAKKPKERYSSMADFAKALEIYLLAGGPAGSLGEYQPAMMGDGSRMAKPAPKKKKKKEKKQGKYNQLIVGLVVGFFLGVGMMLLIRATESPEGPAPVAKAPPGKPGEDNKKKKKPPRNTWALNLDKLEFAQFGKIYLQEVLLNGVGPASLEAMGPEINKYAKVKERLSKGQITMVWKVRLNNLPNASATALAWEIEADDQGIRIVLMCDGSVRTLNEKQFAKTPKATGG